ncbi:MAG: hypothetical protein ABR550_00070 [Wenzhouxiangellaceae bacterium]
MTLKSFISAAAIAFQRRKGCCGRIVSFCSENGTAAYHREIVQDGDRHRLREAASSYTRHFDVEMAALSG